MKLFPEHLNHKPLSYKNFVGVKRLSRQKCTMVKVGNKIKLSMGFTYLFIYY